MVFVGVDGGATRTRAVAVGDDGRVQAWTVAGPGNYQQIGLGGLGELLAQVAADLGLAAIAEPVVVCLALAGAGRPGEQAQVAALVRARGWAQKAVVVSDARAALEGAHAGASGIIVIAGTGSIVLGKGLAGAEVRAGGWGPLLGDEGSGYALGLQGLRAVFRARDGWGVPTRLSTDLLVPLGLAAWDELIGPLYAGSLGRERIAALAPAVLGAAAADDAAAAAIVAREGRCLGRQVAAVAGRLGLSGPVPVAGAGGVLGDGEGLWRPLMASACRGGALLERRAALLPPVLGAALLAWHSSGRPVGPEITARLGDSAPKLP